MSNVNIMAKNLDGKRSDWIIHPRIRMNREPPPLIRLGKGSSQRVVDGHESLLHRGMIIGGVVLDFL